MKNPVDNMLTSRIKQVFDEFEDPGAAAGWEQLRKKYPERSHRHLILWLSSAAAILLLATGLWIVNIQETPMVMKPVKEENSLAGTETKPNAADSVIPVKTASRNLSKPGTQTQSDEGSLDNGEPATQKTLTAALPMTATDKEPLNLSRAEPAEQFPEKVLVAALEDEIPLARAATVAIKNRPDFDQVLIKQAKKPSYIAEFNPDPLESEKKHDKVSTKRQKLAMSLFAGSYFNYAEGSENQLNFGAGFTSDIRLNRNLKLSTGLSIASNSLNYDSGQNVPESVASDFNSVAPSTGQNISLNLTTITRYSASLLALDIPVNIKYQFVSESDKIYVVAGLSSGTYLNETYGFQYRSFNTASGIYSSQAKAQEIKKQLKDFDFARTLNLSFGISTDFGKNQTMSIEPFVKYPLGGLGTEDLKFGSTGINLKIRFNPTKK